MHKRFLAVKAHLGLIAFFVALGLAFIATPAQAAIRYVDPNGVNGGACDSPANACDSLTDAITAANPTDEIRVAKGTYTEPQISISKQVKITGGFDPAVPNGWDTSTYTQTPTIFDGEGTHRVFYIPTDGVVVENLTVTNGDATNAVQSPHLGGGILIANGENVVLRALRVTNNTASTTNAGSIGGGIAIVSISNVDIDRTFVFSNSAALGGGIGISVASPNTTILEVNSSVIAHNEATEGGALATTGTGRSVVTIYHTTFGDNNKGTPGADEAIFMNQGGDAANRNSLDISRSLATGNTTFFRSNLTQPPVMMSTGIIIDTSITSDWEGNLPGLNPALRRALPFVDTAAGNYHLAALSPAIDIAGNTLRIDLDGRQRVASANCTPFTLCSLGRADDYGAYEYVYTAPSIRYVAVEGDKDNNNCLNSALPCSTIDDANALALGGDEIRIAVGSYSGGDSICGNEAVLCIRQGISVTGGYTLTNWLNPSPDPTLTIINGTGIRRGIEVDYDAPTASSLIRNLTVREGKTLGDGGGIAVGTRNLGPAQNLTIQNTHIVSNTVTGDGDGGGIYADDPVNLRIENTVIYSNTVYDGRGGGLAIIDADGNATYTLTKLTVHTNVAERPDENSANGGRGGGIFLEGVGTLAESEVYNNRAAFTGGGVSVGSNDANPLINRLYIHDNQAPVGGGFSIFLTGGATLQNSLLVRNSATSDTPVTGQSTEIVGGNAIHTPEGGSPTKPLRAINVTIADNDGAVPEAVKVEGLADTSMMRTNVFTNVLISGNEIGIRSDGLGVATLAKVLITNDVTTKLDGFANDRLTGSALDGVAGFVGGGNYHLLPGADGVDDGETVAGVTQDLDGINRPVGPAFDIGAYETTLQKQNQTITFTPIANRALADSPFAVNPIASSGLPVQVISETPTVCTISALQVTLVAEGTCILKASQPGNETFNPAPDVTRSFDVGVQVPQERMFMPALKKE